MLAAAKNFAAQRSLTRNAMSRSALLASSRAIAWSHGRIISTHEFVARLLSVKETLPGAGAMINLCEDRFNFLIAFAAALYAEHATLLPASRAPEAIAELTSRYAHSYCYGDAEVDRASRRSSTEELPRQGVRDDSLALIGFTSGSTGDPQAHRKSWERVRASTELVAAAIRAAMHLEKEAPTPWLVATVPPQHTYGLELSVLLPLLGDMAVHSGRPLFPADVAAALSQVPEPRVLISTPIHLRALLKSSQVLPPLAGIVSATAPLDSQLAIDIERRFATTLLEVFGSTETCNFATRQTARQDAWQTYAGVVLTPRADGTLVSAPWFDKPVVLPDIVEVLPNGNFVVRGRNSDFIDVAGKRASLADLTHRLLAVEGVRDAIVLPAENAGGPAQRIAALAVAPGLDAGTVLERLSAAIDPAFMPRPLVLVDALPRNETGKLPREQLLKLLRHSTPDK
jgi:acyl-coenzyme A synthetase/AMP-(fatty) acid ligase